MTDRLIANATFLGLHMFRARRWSIVLSEPQIYVTTGDAGTWAIDRSNRVVYQWSPDSSSWDYTGSDLFKSIDSGPKQYVFAVRSNGVLAYRDGISELTPSGLRWINLDRTLKSVSVGSYGVWGVDDSGAVHFARRPSNMNVFPLSWTVLKGPSMAKVDAGFGNHVWGVTKSGEVMQRIGVSHETPLGERWETKGLTARDITVGLEGIFAINTRGRIIQNKGMG